MAVADAHEFFGPVRINWEGGISGEKVIQTVSPGLGIMRANVAWKYIALDRLYQSAGIAWLLERLDPPCEATGSRSTTDLYRVFKNSDEMLAAVGASLPLACIVAEGQLFLVYRPRVSDMAQCAPINKAGTIGRSTIWLAPIDFDDNDGEEIGGCWFAPVRIVKDKPHLTGIGTLVELHKIVQLRCLLLPLVSNVLIWSRCISRQGKVKIG